MLQFAIDKEVNGSVYRAIHWMSSTLCLGVVRNRPRDTGTRVSVGKPRNTGRVWWIYNQARAFFNFAILICSYSIPTPTYRNTNLLLCRHQHLQIPPSSKDPTKNSCHRINKLQMKKKNAILNAANRKALIFNAKKMTITFFSFLDYFY